MKIISHRGYWKKLEEKNQEIAFRRSFELGFGTETDLRDCAGKIVISHDPPDGGEMTLEYFLEIYTEYHKDLPLALNIKADGLQSSIKNLLDRYRIIRYFVFDMSIPDARLYLNQGFNVFARQSEIETIPCFYESVIGVWIDSFLGDWPEESVILNHLNAGKQVCIVSSELHEREHHYLWEQLYQMSVINDPCLMLCTDYPESAREFFG